MESIASEQQPAKSSNTHRITRGLVLSGGGALAAYEVGVMKALLTGQSSATRHTTIDVDVLSATSAGAVNAGIFLSASDQGTSNAVNYLEKVWLDDIGDGPGKCDGGAFRFRANPASLVNPACYFPNPLAPWLALLKDSAFLTEDLLRRSVAFGLSPQDIEQRMLEFTNLGTLVADDSYRAVLRDRIRLDKIRSAKTALKIATTNWKTGQLKIFTNTDMTDQNGAGILLASSAIPGLFNTVEIQGDPYVDGGVVMNTPLKPAIDAGAEELHVIYMDPEVASIPFPRLANTASSLNRSLVISFSGTIKRDLLIAAEVNRQLALIRRSAGSNLSDRSDAPSRTDGINRLQNKEGRSYWPLTVHIYHPSQALSAGWFTFARARLKELIDRGYQDAVAHDCMKNRCILPQ